MTAVPLCIPLFTVVLVHEWYIFRAAGWSGGGGLQFRVLSDGDAESVGDVARSGEAGRAIVVGFVALDLLLGHPKRLSELALGPPAGDARLDEHRRELLQRGSIER